MKKIVNLLVIFFAGIEIFAQTIEDPAHWVDYCINWTVKTEQDVLALGVEQISEVDLRPYNGRLLRQYLYRKTKDINIVFSSWDGVITDVEYRVDYNDKTLFQSDAIMARQIINAYGGYVKNNRQSSLFPQYGNITNDAYSILYEANLERIFEITITVNSDYPDRKWSGFIWVSVNRKQ